MTKRDKRAQRKQYKFVLKELVGREIKKKICKVLSWNCMECFKSIAFHDCIICDFFKNVSKVYRKLSGILSYRFSYMDHVYRSHQCGNDYFSG